MLIGGFQKQSLIDYKGKISSIIFTIGCNFKCPYCHNPELISFNNLNKINKEDIFEYLEKNKNMIDAVVITGGEPTLQKDLIDFIKEIKEFGFLVKLDTNGTNFEVLEYLIIENLIDFVAMDVKAPLDFESYKKIVKNLNENSFNNILKSINLLKQNYVEYEFRTTIVKDLLSLNDIIQIYNFIKPAKTYSLQKFRNGKTLNDDFDKNKKFTQDELEYLKKTFTQIEELNIR